MTQKKKKLTKRLYIFKEDGCWHWEIVASNGKPDARSVSSFSRRDTALNSVRALGDYFGSNDFLVLYEHPDHVPQRRDPLTIPTLAEEILKCRLR